MEYCITMERTLRFAVRFDADNVDQAQEKALEIYDGATPEDFEQGDEKHDYALCDEYGKTIIDWD